MFTRMSGASLSWLVKRMWGLRVFDQSRFWKREVMYEPTISGQST